MSELVMISRSAWRHASCLISHRLGANDCLFRYRGGNEWSPAHHEGHNYVWGLSRADVLSSLRRIGVLAPVGLEQCCKPPATTQANETLYGEPL